jgi:hypothetical protein
MREMPQTYLEHCSELFLCVMVLGFELPASHLLGRCLPPEPLYQLCFVLGIFKIVSLELFFRAGFKLQSS